MFIESPGNLCCDFGSAPGHLVIASRELAEQLQKVSHAEAEFRPVDRLGRGRKSYVEPVPSGHLPRPVALKDEGEIGWKCPDCGHEYLYHDHRTHRTTSFYRRTEIPVHLGVFWLTGGLNRVDLCVSAQWWKQNRGKSWARGVVAHPIGIADDSDIDPRPKLRSREAPGYDTNHLAKWRRVQERSAADCGLPFEAWAL